MQVDRSAKTACAVLVCAIVSVSAGLRSRPASAAPGRAVAAAPARPSSVATPGVGGAREFFGFARMRDGTLMWCDEGDDPDALLLLARRAARYVGADEAGIACADDPSREEGVAWNGGWSELLGPAREVRIGPKARASLARAMDETGMGDIPPHVETDGAMGLCNRCGAMWVPGANAGAGPVTWRALRVRLAEFIARHRPCGVPRPDGRVGLAPEGDLPVRLASTEVPVPRAAGGKRRPGAR